VEERRSESGVEGDDKLVQVRWVESDKPDHQQVGEVPWEVHSKDEVKHDRKNSCWFSM